MALRASSPEADLEATVYGDDADDAGVEHGGLIRSFVRTALRREDVRPSRDALAAALGDGAVCDVAGVAAFFDGINRIADATGTVLDERVRPMVELDLSAMGAGAAERM